MLQGTDIQLYNEPRYKYTMNRDTMIQGTKIQ